MKPKTIRCAGRAWRRDDEHKKWHPGEERWVSGGGDWRRYFYTVTLDNHGWHWWKESYPRRINANGIEETRSLAMIAAIRASRRAK